MIEKIQVVIIETNGVTKAKSTYEVGRRKLSQKRLEEIKGKILKALGVQA